MCLRCPAYCLVPAWFTRQCSGSLPYLSGILGLLGACRPPQPSIDIAPSDQRAVYSVTIDDAGEVALLTQEADLEGVVLDGTTLYFIGAPAVLERLRASGYTPILADRLQVERRVVRVYRRGEERALVETGVRLINRERDYWVVDGTLQQLQMLQRLGYRLGSLGPNEPRHREVRILVRAREDVQRVNELHVDIYSVQETPQGIVINAGAYDGQIDALRAAGYQVELVSTVR